MNILVQALTKTARLPIKATTGSAGFDLYVDAAYPEPEGFTVHTGLAFALPPGTVMLVFPRSGLASQYGLTLRNSTGIIDSDYRGEILLKFNPGFDHLKDEIIGCLQKGQRVAQAIIVEVPAVTLEAVDNLPSTVRGAGGFGSTGV